MTGLAGIGSAARFTVVVPSARSMSWSGPLEPTMSPKVIWAVAEGDRSIRPDTDPLEASAALDGALRGLVLAESLGAPVTGQIVRVTRE